MTLLLSVSIQDADGDVKSLPLYSPSTTLTPTQIVSAIPPLLLNLDAVLDGQILGVTVTYDFGTAGTVGLKTAPNANSEVQKGALFTMNAATTPYKDGIYVPAFLPSLFVTGSDAVDVDNADVSAFIATLTDGVATTPTGDLLFSDRYGNDLYSLYRAVKRFRK